MDKRDIWAWARMTALPLALATVATAVGCRDSSSPDSSSLKRRSGNAAAVRNEPKLKKAHEWIGSAHNQGLDDLRAELRKPGTLSNDFCGYAIGFSTKDERFPKDKATGHSINRRDIARSVLKEAKLCAPETNHTVARQEDGLSPGISALVAQAQAEIDLASDRYDLERRLSAVWQSAVALSETEAAIVASTLTTAQSSFEYWESEIERATQEFEAEYGGCARTASSDGYSYEQARLYCLEGGALPALGPRYAPSPVRIAGLLPARGCQLSTHFKTLAKADVGGAFSGAIKGALSGGLAGIGPGALIGGIVGSAGSWAYSAWDLYWCALK